MPAKNETRKEVDQTLLKNMRFYSQVMDTPKEAQKAFNNGSFSGTDINPMYRIKRLTELFGPAGFGWWTKNVKYDFVESPETKEVSVFCELELYIRDPETGLVSEPIYGIGGNTYVKQWKSGPKASDEAKKMAYTDALGIACKALGVGHDIWFANDKTKYTENSVPVQNNEVPDVSGIQGRIQRGLQMLTKDMNAEQKEAFVAENVVSIIGKANYRECQDSAKLQALLDHLLSKVQKAA